jgi:hypothetical protein
VNQETAWPGQNGNAEPGTFIEFPVSRDRFVDLYSTKSKAKMADLDQRIAAHFSHVWMKQDQVTGGLVRLHYNGVAITPFSFTAPDVFEFVDSHVKSDFTLSSGGHITLEEIKLKPTARRLPGSYKFRFALDANGLVFFKNGRWIESIHTDEPGRQLYSRILGGKPHNGHNGHIKLVNMTGTQAQLPATVPTKNRFSISPLFEELVTQLYDKIRVKLYVAGPDPEACMVTEYRKRMEKAVASLGLAVRYEQERVFQLPTGANCPPVDLTMETGDRIELMEFKRATRPQTDHFAQLFLNWKLASEASAKPVRPVLVLMKGDNNEVSAAHQQYVHVLATSGFRPEVRTTEGDMIWRLD